MLPEESIATTIETGALAELEKYSIGNRWDPE